MQIRDAPALVTGAGRGIGKAIALALGRAGARVTTVARSVTELDALVGEIQDAGGRARACAGDLCDPDFPARAVQDAVAAYGRLQVVVNNAGVGASAPLVEMTDEEWRRVLDTNVTAVFRLTRAALPHLTRGGGHIFMLSSLAGQNAIPGMSAYCASKAALDHMSACLMQEVRQQGVKVTVIAPGSVDTRFMGRTEDGAGSWRLTAGDVADTLMHLLSSRDAAHLSRVEMRPARPPAKG